MKKQKGFSLIELLIVVAIILIIAAMIKMTATTISNSISEKPRERAVPVVRNPCLVVSLMGWLPKFGLIVAAASSALHPYRISVCIELLYS